MGNDLDFDQLAFGRLSKPCLEEAPEQVDRHGRREGLVVRRDLLGQDGHLVFLGDDLGAGPDGPSAVDRRPEVDALGHFPREANERLVDVAEVLVEVASGDEAIADREVERLRRLNQNSQLEDVGAQRVADRGVERSSRAETQFEPDILRKGLRELEHERTCAHDSHTFTDARRARHVERSGLEASPHAEHVAGDRLLDRAGYRLLDRTGPALVDVEEDSVRAVSPQRHLLTLVGTGHSDRVLDQTIVAAVELIPLGPRRRRPFGRFRNRRSAEPQDQGQHPCAQILEHLVLPPCLPVKYDGTFCFSSPPRHAGLSSPDGGAVVVRLTIYVIRTYVALPHAMIQNKI